MHINVKPFDKYQSYECAESAIRHLFIYDLYPQQHWADVHFGRDLAAIRKVTQAIRDKDASTFKASRRRGYWRAELAA